MSIEDRKGKSRRVKLKAAVVSGSARIVTCSRSHNAGNCPRLLPLSRTMQSLRLPMVSVRGQ